MKVLDEAQGKDWDLYHADCVQATAGLPSNSIDLTVSSLPFSNIYTYSSSAYDMGNTENDGHFFEQFKFLIPELLRVTVPGRLCIMHCKDLPLYAGRDGSTGLRDFPGEIIRAFEGDTRTIQNQLDGLEIARYTLESNGADTVHIDAAIAHFQERLIESAKNNWVYHSRVNIWKDPVIERARTNNNGLLYKTATRDTSQCRQGMNDYLLVFRKWTDDMQGLTSHKPVTRDGERFVHAPYIGTEPPGRKLNESMTEKDKRYYSIDVWQRYASGTWFDIHQTDVLNTDMAKENQDERHICPLQLDLIGRCIELWSNPGDVIFDPFNGIGSTGHEALKMGRKYIGIELKRSYFNAAVRFLSNAACENQLSLLDLLAASA